MSLPALKSYLAEVEARIQKATEGPWVVEGSKDRQNWRGIGIKSEDELFIANMVFQPDDREMDNAKFLAASRQDLPRLLGLVKAVFYILETLESYSKRQHINPKIVEALSRFHAEIEKGGA